jgi:translation initiation factor IF-3
MINDRIRYPQVRVIDDENNQLGVMETRDAIDLARDRGFDLILVAAQAQPPVCRIMDYGKYKYEKSKREKSAHKKSAATELKMVRLHPRTSVHDRGILVRHAEKFLREGHKVRVVCQFKGRENAYPQLGRDQLDAVAGLLAEISTVEGTINKQGREMAMMLSPKPGVKPLPKEDKTGGKKGSANGAAVEETHDDEAEFEAVQASVLAEHDAVADDEDEAVDATSAVNEANGADTTADAAVTADEVVTADEAKPATES